MFKKKQMKVVARKDGSKVVHYNRLRKYLFNPTRATDKETTDTVIELASTAVEAVITELEDKRKATFNYLDISGSEYCFANCTADRKAALMGVTATNIYIYTTMTLTALAAGYIIVTIKQVCVCGG